MTYKIDNAIVKREHDGRITLIDPENIFSEDDAFVAVRSDDLITIQLLINSILNNDFKKWKTIGEFPDNSPLKSLFIRLGYTKDDIAKLLKYF